MVELESSGRAAGTARVERVSAALAIALPDLPPNGGRDGSPPRLPQLRPNQFPCLVVCRLGRRRSSEARPSTGPGGGFDSGFGTSLDTGRDAECDAWFDAWFDARFDARPGLRLDAGLNDQSGPARAARISRPRSGRGSGGAGGQPARRHGLALPGHLFRWSHRLRPGPRPLHHSAAPGLLLQEQIDGLLDDLLEGGARPGVVQASPGGPELLEEPSPDGQMEPAEVGRQELDGARWHDRRVGQSRGRIGAWVRGSGRARSRCQVEVRGDLTFRELPRGGPGCREGQRSGGRTGDTALGRP